MILQYIESTIPCLLHQTRGKNPLMHKEVNILTTKIPVIYLEDRTSDCHAILVDPCWMSCTEDVVFSLAALTSSLGTWNWTSYTNENTPWPLRHTHTPEYNQVTVIRHLTPMRIPSGFYVILIYLIQSSYSN